MNKNRLCCKVNLKATVGRNSGVDSRLCKGILSKYLTALCLFIWKKFAHWENLKEESTTKKDFLLLDEAKSISERPLKNTLKIWGS